MEISPSDDILRFRLLSPPGGATEDEIAAVLAAVQMVVDHESPEVARGPGPWRMAGRLEAQRVPDPSGAIPAHWRR